MRFTSIVFALLLAIVCASPASAADAAEPTDCDVTRLAALDLESLLEETVDETPATEISEVPEGQQIDLIGGTPCGGVICSGATPVCCNPSCNRCVPKGWGCTQESCN